MFSTYIYPTGLKYIYGSLACAVIGMFFGFGLFSNLFLGLGLFLVWFFRNPKRTALVSTVDQIISPADGVVIKILDDVTPPLIKNSEYKKWKQVSIFMRVYDVHVNRAPIAGKVKQVLRTAGKFKYAAAGQADSDNERTAILIEGKYPVVCQQVAGMLARRILCNVSEGSELEAGDIYGFIQVGSRADLFFPDVFDVCVQKGDVVKAGLNYIAQIKKVSVI